MSSWLAIVLHRDLLWVLPLVISLAGIYWWFRHHTPHRPLAGRLRHLDQAADKCRDVGLDVATGGHGLAMGLRQHAASLHRSSEELAELSTHATQAASAAAEAAELTHSHRQAAQKSAAQVDGVLTAMCAARTSIAQTAEALEAVGEITVQANLLALSVAVGAARAGVGGEALGRMAEDLRLLAVRTNQAVNVTAKRVQGCLEQSRSGEQAIAGLRLTLGEHDTVGNRVVRLIHELASAEKEQATELSQLNQILSQSAQALDRSAAAADVNATASSELSTHAEQVLKLARRLSAEFGCASDAALSAPAAPQSVALPVTGS